MRGVDLDGVEAAATASLGGGGEGFAPSPCTLRCVSWRGASHPCATGSLVGPTGCHDLAPAVICSGVSVHYPVSAAFTMPLALPKSICPANFAFSTAITLPISFMPAAPVSAMAADIAAFTSSSDICFGK